MDFMKVFDQTVREIKREVNIKVLKVPEIEQKVLDATSDEPWGPHGSDLTEIAQGTRKITECQMIMNVLWSRLNERGRNWRCAYKALAVIEYLVANGSERAVDDIIEHTFKISSLSSFEYLEPNGKDMGINVRKKVETIVGLLNDKNKIQEVRNKAATNRDKYIGLSSNGITYKSSAASFGSSNFQNSDRYGGFGGKNDGGMFKDSYKEKDRYGGEELDNDSRKSRRGASSESERNKSSKGSTRHSRDRDALASSSKSNQSDDKFAPIPPQSSTTPNDTDDDFDDFNPRGTSSTGLAAPTVVNQVDLFGDLMDAPLAAPPEPSSANGSANPEVDLFADADFVSASPHIEAGSNSQIRADVDLFASQPTLPSASTIDFFAAPDPVPQTETKSSKSESLDSSAFDPFAAVPLNNFDGSESTDNFGAFTSHTDQVSSQVSSQNSPTDSSLNSLNQNPSVETKGPKKDTFKVKSGIWADSLSRGIIDLNITAPEAAKKTTNLADIGIVGGLGDGSDEKGPPTSFYMGRAMGMGMGMGMGSGYGQSGFTSTGTTGSGDDDFFSSLSREQQYGSFQKKTEKEALTQAAGSALPTSMLANCKRVEPVRRKAEVL